jgi:hypothetical protein
MAIFQFSAAPKQGEQVTLHHRSWSDSKKECNCCFFTENIALIGFVVGRLARH